MKPSEECKQAGLSSLNQLSEITGESVQTLNNWYKNKPKLFKVVLAGAVVLLHGMDYINSRFLMRWLLLFISKLK